MTRSTLWLTWCIFARCWQPWNLSMQQLESLRHQWYLLFPRYWAVDLKGWGMQGFWCLFSRYSHFVEKFQWVKIPVCRNSIVFSEYTHTKKSVQKYWYWLGYFHISTCCREIAVFYLNTHIYTHTHNL